MREEVKNWIRQSEEDFDSAKANYKIGKHYVVAFFCQQAVEKGLKGLIIFKTKTKFLPEHSLIRLGKKCKIPSRFESDLKKLSPQYFLSRYPDASEDLPSELYDKETSENFLKIAEEVLAWIKSQLK